MKPKTLILMVVAVACGLGASYMTSRLLADRQSDVEKVTILVAKKSLNQGEWIKAPDDLFEGKQFAKGDEPKLAITEMDKLVGQQLKRPLRAGDFVTLDDLRDEKQSMMDTVLPPGHQAIGIRVSPEKTAGGFANLPNSKVNIISVVRRGSDRESYAKILLENVLVLAADANMRVGEDGKAMPANVVTVALKPEDVLKVELAQSMGTISLALRKANDYSKSETTKVTAEGLGPDQGTPVEATHETAPPPKEQPKATPTPVVVTPRESTGSVHTLDIYNGTQHQRHQIRTNDASKKEETPPDDGN